MSLDHPLVNRSWITYEIDKDGHVTTILNVEPTMPVNTGTQLEGSIAEAIVSYMREHSEVDRAVVFPRNLP